MATRESEVAGGCTTRERFVWSTEEDSALSAYQRKVLRDNKIARMLEEMRATLRHFHKASICIQPMHSVCRDAWDTLLFP